MRPPDLNLSSDAASIASGDSPGEKKTISSSAFKAIRKGFQVPKHEDADNLIYLARFTVNRILEHLATDAFLTAVVVFDIWMTAMAIDHRAADSEKPAWVFPADITCLCVYFLELACHAFVKRWDVLNDTWLLPDAVFVFAGFTEIVLASFEVDYESIGILRVLRAVRIARTVKLLRKLSMLQEVRKIMILAATCFKTLGWLALFCYIVMTSFAMLSVEFIGPLVKEMVASGTLDACGDPCAQSMKSVTIATLYFFKTAIASDGWADLAWPMIEKAPWTALVFISSILILMFGFLNLVIAVVIDSATEQRMNDVQGRAEQLTLVLESDQDLLAKMFASIDSKSSGMISLDQLMEGANSLPEFQNRLRVMDIDPQDLEQLFYMVDADGGGTIDQEEFTGTLSRWMVNDSKTAARFAKHNIQLVLHEQKKLQDSLGRIMEQVNDLRESQDYLGCMQGVFVEEQRQLAGSNFYRTGRSSSLGIIPAQGASIDRRSSSERSVASSPPPGPASGNGEVAQTLQPLQCVLNSLREDMDRLELTIGNISMKQLEPVLRHTDSTHFTEMHHATSSEHMFKDLDFASRFELQPEFSIQV
eukprot:TRINITY_DN18066_c0_g1_i1.p1 TRINITY_DN18066_c0_g1~~TRINITY_DN18066_c0_g1_i1.p1  ORF type:complete len:590 (+),score=100.42 TRINITY_DN18066_c0_g1_i1:45-1814(+)